MPITRLADVIVPEVYEQYVAENLPAKLALLVGDILTRVPQLDKQAGGAGATFHIPFWGDLEGDDEVRSDVEALTPEKIGSDKMIGVKLKRDKAWASNTLASEMTGSDPMKRIAERSINYWLKRYQRVIVSILNGVFDANIANNDSDLVKAVFDAETPVPLTGDVILDAKQLLGDASESLVDLYVHSAVKTQLEKAQLIETQRDPQGRVMGQYYLGYRIHQDDTVPVNASTGEYTSYLLGKGVIGFGSASAPNAVEVDRDSLANDDILINRRNLVMHPVGHRFKSATMAGSTPNNTELATADNWERVFTKKNVPMVAIKHNLTA